MAVGWVLVDFTVHCMW